MATKTKKGLGRGLEAILGEPSPQRADIGRAGAGTMILPVTEIAPDPDQPRKTFGDEELGALAASVAAQGILQPILVRPKTDGVHLIIAGERRWRAAQKAGLHEVPVLIREVGEGGTAELALIENVQRVDLNPIEEADAYARLRDVFSRKPAEIADAVGKSRSHVANMLRLTALDPEIKAMVIEGTLSMGHARALLTAPDAVALARKVVAKDLSVRETEALAAPKLVTKKGPSEPAAAKPKAGGAKDADTKAMERDLEAALGLVVSIDHQGKEGGEVRIDYRTLDELDDVCARLMGTGI